MTNTEETRNGREDQRYSGIGIEIGRIKERERDRGEGMQREFHFQEQYLEINLGRVTVTHFPSEHFFRYEKVELRGPKGNSEGAYAILQHDYIVCVLRGVSESDALSQCKDEAVSLRNSIIETSRIRGYKIIDLEGKEND